MRSQVHPALLSAIQPAFFRSRATVQRNSGTTIGRDKWQNVAGLVDIPCAFGPGGEGRSAPSREQRRTAMTAAVQGAAAVLAGNFPEITSRMRALIDAVAFNILAVDQSSTRMLTRLRVERVTA